MNYRFPNSPPPGGFFTRLLGAIVGAVIMVGLFFLGLTVFAAAAGIALVAFVIFYLRLLWLRRKAGKGAGYGPGNGQVGPNTYTRREETRRESVTLEGEYREKNDR
jgi:hypothetical protein